MLETILTRLWFVYWSLILKSVNTSGILNAFLHEILFLIMSISMLTTHIFPLLLLPVILLLRLWRRLLLILWLILLLLLPLLWLFRQSIHKWWIPLSPLSHSFPLCYSIHWFFILLHVIDRILHWIRDIWISLQRRSLSDWVYIWYTSVPCTSWIPLSLSFSLCWIIWWWLLTPFLSWGLPSFLLSMRCWLNFDLFLLLSRFFLWSFRAVFVALFGLTVVELGSCWVLLVLFILVHL